jgi:uncharacterized membrane protein
MDNFASEMHTIGLFMGPYGFVLFGVGMLLARNVRFPPWIGASVQYAGIGFVLAGAVYYFEPWGAQMSLHIGTVIYLIVFVAAIRRYRQAGQAAKGNLPQ